MNEATKRNRSGSWRNRVARVLGGGMALGLTLAVGAAAPEFSEDFSRTEPGKIPDGFLVLEGQFAVKEDGGNRFLELPGVPLETFGVMFGPAAKQDWEAQARFRGTGQGRRLPEFGLGLNGVAGYRIQVSPAKKSLEVFKEQEPKASAPFAWESGTWTQIRIRVRKTGDASWRIEGKAWKDGTPEPEAWTVGWDEAEEPITGRAAVWGKPFSGTPIAFDDLKVRPSAR